MLRILKSNGILYNFIQAIALTYKDTYSKVITSDGETDNFQITKEEPFLFVITLDYVMRQAIDGREKEFGLEII